MPFGKLLLSLCIFIALLGLGNITFSAYSKGSLENVENNLAGVIVPENKPAAKPCCGQTENAVETFTLVGAYYSLKNGQDTILMFNNKGPQPLVVSPAFFSLSGDRLDIPALTIPAKSYQEFDLRVLLANNLPQYREGSLQMSHQGGRLQLGAQFKILKQGMLFDEQFIQPATRFPSTRLESVWYLPSSQAETKFILSNTTASSVTATVAVNGTSLRQNQPAIIQLNAHETRVLDILQDLVGQQNGGTLKKDGGISINHTGAAGAIMARILISEPSTGFSSVVNFTDPTTPLSSKMNGGGLRIGSIGNDELKPIVVARNIGTEPTTVKGKIPYTDAGGEVAFVTIPDVQILPNKSKTINLSQEIEAANIPADVTFAGLNLEYSTAPGTVVMNAQSVSRSGQQVFQVPLLDPERLPSSAGGFPWKVDGDYTTVIFIKNEADAPKRYIGNLTYEGGTYSLGVRELKPWQTVMIDFKQLRDSQTPDSSGHLIPLNMERGQASWTMMGAGNKKMSGRSEQVNTTLGISSTYACYNCCPDNIYSTGQTFPASVETETGGSFQYLIQAESTNCYGALNGTFSLYGGGWYSSNTNVATIDGNGNSLAAAPGIAEFTGNFGSTRYDFDGRDCIETNLIEIGQGGMEVRPPEVTFTTIGSIEQGGSKNITATVRNRGSYQITLFLRTSQNQSTSGVTFDNGSTSKVLPNNNGDHTVVIKGINSSTQLNDYKIEARYDNNVFLAGTEYFTVSSLSFGEESTCSGFDNNYLLVPKSGTNKVKAYISPSGASGNFKLEVSTSPANQVAVSPTTVSANDTVITVTGGNTVGNFKINVSANQQNSSIIGELNVYVRNRKDKTLIFWAVTEDGNPDTPPPSSNVPTATGLQAYLNNIWGKQANVYFTVTKGTDFEVNYDLNNDVKIDSQAPGSEPLAIINTEKDETKDFNIYFLGLGVKTLPNGTTPAAFSYFDYEASWIGRTYSGTRDYITAHEIGHLLGVSGQFTDNTFLMYESDLLTSPCKIGKREWDIVNP